jgi:hypothetical protein
MSSGQVRNQDRVASYFNTTYRDSEFLPLRVIELRTTKSTNDLHLSRYSLVSQDFAIHVLSIFFSLRSIQNSNLLTFKLKKFFKLLLTKKKKKKKRKKKGKLFNVGGLFTSIYSLIPKWIKVYSLM